MKQIEGRGFLWRFFLLLLCLMLAAVNTGNNLLYLVLSVMIAVAAVSWFIGGRSLGRVEARLELPGEIAAGNTFLLGVEAQARKGKLPSPWADAVVRGLPGAATPLAIPSLGPGSRAFASAPARAMKRGILQGLRLELHSRYPFGLFLRKRRIDCGGTMVVTPRVHPIRALRIHQPAGLGKVNMSRVGEGGELFNIREYTRRDDARRIDWKASARTSRPMLKEFERESEQVLEVVLDERSAGPGSRAGGDDGPFERLVETAASILHHCEDRGIRGRLLVPGDGSASRGLEGRGAMAYLATAHARPDAPSPDLVPAGTEAPRIVLSLDPSARSGFEVEWAAPGEAP